MIGSKTILTSDGVNLTIAYIADVELFNRAVAEDDPHTHDEWMAVVKKTKENRREHF